MNKRLIYLLFMLFITASVSAQVSFTKPGSMMRIPTSSVYQAPYIFRAGFGADFYSFGGTTGMKSAKGVFFDSQLSQGFNFGFSAAQNDMTADSGAVEFGINLTKNLLNYGDISIAIGLWDFVFTQVDGNMQLKKDYSFFGVISSEKTLGNMGLNTYMGIGTGGLAAAFAANDTVRTAGIFAGFLLKTNVFSGQGGIDVIGEFDGSGINAGIRIPLTSDYKFSIGVSQIQWLPNFGKEGATDLPAISVGLSLEIPRLDPVARKNQAAKPKTSMSGLFSAGEEPVQQVQEDTERYQAQLDSVLQVADIEIQKMKDSLRVSMAEVENLQNTTTLLRQQKSVLEDSLQSIKLQHHVMEQNINLALKHLSRSLRYFYEGDYEEALNEVDMAIQLNPNLALAYARRGSIYYKMGDLQRATINWNLALRIDPEYDDVRNILKIINENRIRTVSYEHR